MGTFIGDISVRPVGDLWRVEAPVAYLADDRREYQIPVGTLTDWASFPTLLCAFLRPDDPRWIEGALLHDDAYARHHLSRRQADALFSEAMDGRGAPGWLRWIIWAGVRLGGWWAYRTGPARRNMK